MKRHAVLWSLIVLAVVMLAPFVIVALNAVKSPAQYASDGPLALPSDITFQGIIDFWDRVGFGQKLLNSFIISGSVAVLAVVVSVLNAYALGIGRIRGRSWILIAFLVVIYLVTAFSPPPPDARTLAWSALTMWLLVPWA